MTYAQCKILSCKKLLFHNHFISSLFFLPPVPTTVTSVGQQDQNAKVSIGSTAKQRERELQLYDDHMTTFALNMTEKLLDVFYSWDTNMLAAKDTDFDISDIL